MGTMSTIARRLTAAAATTAAAVTMMITTMPATHAATAAAGSHPTSTIGVFRPSDPGFILNSDNTHDGSLPAINWGEHGDRPIAGDWTNAGHDNLGVYRDSNHTFYLADNTNAHTATSLTWGQDGDLPVAGNFYGGTTDHLAVYRPSTATFYFTNDNHNGGTTNKFTFGNPGDRPVAGDFDGDGIDTVGVFRPSTGQFFWTNDHVGNKTITTDGHADWGKNGDLPITGNWSATPPPSANQTPKEYAASYELSKYGWGADEFDALNNVWTRESSWIVDNEGSNGAYGIPQAYPASQMADEGPDWRTNPQTQIRWGLGYIKDRYGDPIAAWDFWQAHGWY